MKVLRQLGTLVLLVMSFLTPVMSCIVPSAQMTTVERACCRMMQYQCGEMQMPTTSNPCCHNAPPSVYESAQAERPFFFHHVAVSIWGLPSSELVYSFSTATRQAKYQDYSPPEAPPSTNSVLRI